MESEKCHSTTDCFIEGKYESEKAISILITSVQNVCVGLGALEAGTSFPNPFQEVHLTFMSLDSIKMDSPVFNVSRWGVITSRQER